MAKVELGLMERIDVRDVWKHEALDFTKWLAEDPNLALLGKTLGIELELLERESPVGPKSVDIFAQDAGTDRKVIIENQLEKTDHDHLGKAILYAAGKDAEIIIWITTHAEDVHRQAIEWLNQHTDSNINFFLLEIEVWRIGDSKPAPRFNIVEGPNTWAKVEKSKADLTPGKLLQWEYWQRYQEAALEDPGFKERGLSPQSPHPQHWSTISIGTSRYHLNLRFLTTGTVGIELNIPDNKAIGSAVCEKQDLFEQAVGCKGRFTESEKECTLKFDRDNRDVKNTDEWAGYISWQLQAAAKIFDVIKEIDL